MDELMLQKMKKGVGLGLLRTGAAWQKDFVTKAVAEVSAASKPEPWLRWIDTMADAVVARFAASRLLGFVSPDLDHPDMVAITEAIARLSPQFFEAPVNVPPASPEFYDKAVIWSAGIFRSIAAEELKRTVEDKELARLLRSADSLVASRMLTEDLTGTRGGQALAIRFGMAFAGTLLWDLAETISPLVLPQDCEDAETGAVVDELRRSWTHLFSARAVWLPRTLRSSNDVAAAVSQLAFAVEELNERNPVADIAAVVVKRVNELLEKKLAVEAKA